MHTIVLAGLLSAAALVPSVVTSSSAQTRQPSKSSSGEQFDSYQIPAGTALLLKLRTPFDSATAKVDDQIEASLWSPIIQDGVELIPAESVLTGKISAVVRASNQTPVGSVTFAFAVVQHRSTGDRAMLNTQKIIMEAPPEPVPPGRSSRKRKPADAVMTEGSSFVAVTTQPLIVRIPR